MALQAAGEFTPRACAVVIRIGWVGGKRGIAAEHQKLRGLGAVGRHAGHAQIVNGVSVAPEIIPSESVQSHPGRAVLLSRGAPAPAMHGTGGRARPLYEASLGCHEILAKQLKRIEPGASPGGEADEIGRLARAGFFEICPLGTLDLQHRCACRHICRHREECAQGHDPRYQPTAHAATPSARSKRLGRGKNLRLAKRRLHQFEGSQ